MVKYIKKSKKFDCDGKLVQTYSSIGDAYKKLNIKYSTLSKILNDATNKLLKPNKVSG